MDYLFKADDWERRTPSEQIFRSRVMAEEARRLSLRTSGELSEAYRELAAQWSKLARVLEATLSGKTPTD